MTIGKGTGQKFLKRSQAFEAWVASDSLRKAQETLERDGIINPETNKGPTRMAIRAAAIKFMIDEPDKAKRILAESNNTLADDSEFYPFVLKAARRVVNADEYGDLIRSEPYSRYAGAG